MKTNKTNMKTKEAMKLIKIKEEHYVITDDSKEIKTNDKYLTSDMRIVNWHQEFEEHIKENRPSPITHSTQPLEPIVTDNSFENYEFISIQEVKEIISKMPNGNKIDLLAEKHNFGEFIKINK